MVNPLIKRPYKKLDKSHVIWFSESNSWIQLEKPAWYIYRNYSANIPADIISQKISKYYRLNSAESKVFVNDIISEVQLLSRSTFHAPVTLPAEYHQSPVSCYSCRKYLFNLKTVEICYGSRSLEYTIHPSFAHLEVNSTKKPDFILEVFSPGKKFALKTGTGSWTEDDPGLLKRKLFIELTNLIYGKDEKHWLSYIHGSAVSNGNESIILTTECGAGKSTLAALLCANGLKFVSDDYVPVDARFCKVYPFPAALSVKEGAMRVLEPFFRQLKTAKVLRFKGSDKTVRYLPFPAEKDFYKPLPVRNLVFVKYDPGKPFLFRKMPVNEAIRRFHEEAWLSPNPSHAKKFLSWFPGVNCFELQYSDSKKAIRKILDIFQ